jgi:hypothetical protein
MASASSDRDSTFSASTVCTWQSHVTPETEWRPDELRFAQAGEARRKLNQFDFLRGKERVDMTGE